MKIVYSANRALSDKSDTTTHKDLYVKMDKEYIVYAVGMFRDEIYYCICYKIYSYYPIWKSSKYFDVIDNHLSRCWIFGFEEDNNKKVPFLSFREWNEDPYYYYEPLEGTSDDPNAQIFMKYKALMDLEFPDSSISEIAQIGDETWLICPNCIDAWESKNNLDALVRCPKCLRLYNNPRYKDK